jgi:predicted metal-dependent phosphoesterase TrpH
MNPQDAIKSAKKKGISGIAITDHNTVKGGTFAKRYTSDDFIIISGSEINSEIGHICGLFITEDIKSRLAIEIIDEIHNQSGLAILAHPFKSPKSKFSEDIIKKIDAIEVFNSRTKQNNNQKAYEFAAKNKVPFTAGSDAHFMEEIGNAKLILDNVFDEEDIRHSILNNTIKEEDIKELKLKENPAIIQNISPFYFKTASRIIANLKNGTIYKLPYTVIKSIIKDR